VGQKQEYEPRIGPPDMRGKRPAKIAMAPRTDCIGENPSGQFVAHQGR
jgi:hypothetical protein